ncbi:MAG: hypothetical protein V2A73_07970, partial [Pseudomonadota bacterium]
RISYCGLQHCKGDPFPKDAFAGDENACVDFRYSQSPRLSWWFDHHVSAFALPGDREHFEADKSGRKFYDPHAKACTKLEADVLSKHFGFDVSSLDELVDWAEMIDGAQFPDARTAVLLEQPALRLMTWLETNRDPSLAARCIEDLQARSLSEVAGQPYVAGPMQSIFERHWRTISVIGGRIVIDGGVAFFDLMEDGLEAFNKFIPYLLHPESRYSVALTRSATKVKISVGSNPWSTILRDHDIASICEGYGGGGHKVVGAISLAPGECERGRQIAQEIVRKLNQTGSPSES